MTGIETMRRAVKAFDSCNESFLERFTVPELVAIWEAWRACQWDWYPDSWTPEQVAGAIKGLVPNFDENGKPL